MKCSSYVTGTLHAFLLSEMNHVHACCDLYNTTLLAMASMTMTMVTTVHTPLHLAIIIIQGMKH